MKKAITYLMTLVMAMTMMSMVASASAPIVQNSDAMICFYFDDSGVYKVSHDQLDEILANGDLTEVAQRDSLVPMSESKTRSAQNPAFENNMETVPIGRAKGSWSVTSNTIKPNYITTYSMPGGGAFVVGSGEEFIASIGANKACYLTVGAKGSKNFEVTEWVSAGSGITIATSTTGSYKAHAGNTNSFDITVSGTISVR